jgi:heavy-metal resistance protein
MRTGRVAAVVLTTLLCLGPAGAGLAGGRGAGPRGGHGAGHPGGGPPPAWHGALRGPGVAPHRPFIHDHFWGHRVGRTWIVFGSGFWWGEPWWWGPASPYYAAPPVLVQEAPPVYIEQEPPAPQLYYWYYCQNPPGYFPYVKDCPAGWMTMVPPLGAGRRGAGETRRSFYTYEGPLLTLILSHGQELGLSPDQIQKLQELRTTFEKEAVARGAAIRVAEADLNALLAKDQWDLPAIEAKVQQLATLQGDLRFARIKTLAAGRALLTSEQVQKLEAIGQWTPSPGGPKRMAPRQPAGPGGPPTPQQ